MAAPTAPDPLYQIDYFLGQRAASIRLFKKVDYPGRMRAEVFVLDGERWIRASGLAPGLAGTPEWDPSARPITREEAQHLMQSTGLSPTQIEALLASQEGQRKWPRGEAPPIVPAEDTSGPWGGRLRTY